MDGRGWIKVYRQALHNGWLQNHRLWAFWCYCLMKASHKATEVTVGLQRIQLQPGQFIFGREKAAAELKMTVKQIRTCLDCLKRANNLAVKTANKYSLITVINWHTYQDEESEKGQQDGHQLGTGKGHIQEVKKKNPYMHTGFDDFWNSYPRKVAKDSARKAWAKQKPPLDEVLSALSWQIASDDWQKDAGKFIPYPATWLNGQRWQDAQQIEVKSKCTTPHWY